MLKCAYFNSHYLDTLGSFNYNRWSCINWGQAVNLNLILRT